MITENQVTAAISVLREELSLPFMARASDYIESPDQPPPGPEREAAMAALRAADDEAEQLNRALVRRALQAAADAG